MGMDSVELVMECEEEFGIRISDTDASVVFTPGELAKLVIKLMRRNGAIRLSPACTSTKLFNHIRSGLIDSGCDREQIKPSTPIGSLLDTRKKVRRARYVLDQTLHPQTGRTHSDLFALWCVCPLVLVLGIFLVRLLFSDLMFTYAVLSTMPVYIALTLLSYSCYERRSKLLEPELTIREIIDGALALCEPFSDEPEEADIWFRVRLIVSEQLGQPIERVTPRAHLINDLNMD